MFSPGRYGLGAYLEARRRAQNVAAGLFLLAVTAYLGPQVISALIAYR